jgi:hypothetical protein
MNTSKFRNIYLCSKWCTLLAHGRPRFVNCRKISDDLYAVQNSKLTYKIETPLQCACACLDNAKYYYLNFIYNFLNKCLDPEKFHFIEGDTDSIYLAIAGKAEDGYQQGFKNIIIDEKFYFENVYNWFPNPEKGIEDEKKLLGLCPEKTGSCMIAVGPKCYYLRDFSGKDIMKMKGVNVASNKHIGLEQCLNVIKNNAIIKGENTIFKTQKIDDNNNFGMTIQKQTKIAISQSHNKMIILKNDNCAPFIAIHNDDNGDLIKLLKKDDYLVL